jgi:hypothetical protein
LDTAFVHLLLLLEAIPLPDAHRTLKKKYRKYRRLPHGLAESNSDPDGDWHLHCLPTLEKCVSGIEAMYGLSKRRRVSKELVEIIQATQYAITDSNCFPKPPASEEDVHRRIEAVLRCVFPDLRHKPPIPKPIKNFNPDTGLPSQRTLIEYKFLSKPEDVGRVADEILADTRGYVSSEWDAFFYVIYETQRIKPETEWNHLLEECDTARNTQAIVLCGEPPHPKAGTPTKGDKRPRRAEVVVEDAGDELPSVPKKKDGQDGTGKPTQLDRGKGSGSA